MSSRSYELLSGWALGAFSVGHLALSSAVWATGGPLRPCRAPYTGRPGARRSAASPSVSCCHRSSRCLASLRRRHRASSAWTTLLALAGTGRMAHGLEEFARPQPDEGILLDVLPRRALARRGRLRGPSSPRPSPPWSDPLTSCSAGVDWPSLAPALADVTNGDPGRSHLVLTLGTSLCALVMGAMHS